jgi:hypothetical protein
MMWTIVGLSATSLALWAAAQQREERPSRTPKPYRATPWPADAEPSGRYADTVEEYLNQMAGQGWRFHSTMQGQQAKVMIFERVSTDSP